MKVFQLATFSGSILMPYDDEFTRGGEVWVVHRVGVRRWGVSHRDTGLLINERIDAMSIEEAKTMACRQIDGHAQTEIRATIDDMRAHPAAFGSVGW